MACQNPTTGGTVNFVQDNFRECDNMGPCAGLSSALCSNAGAMCPGVGAYPFRKINIADIGAVGACISYPHASCDRCPGVIRCTLGTAYQQRVDNKCQVPCPSGHTYWKSGANACKN